jgi:molecular chaperone DnaK (HSP70)
VYDDISGNILIPSTILFIKDEIDSSIKVDDLQINKHFIIGSGAKIAFDYKKDHLNYFYQFKRFLGVTSKSINHYKDFIDGFQIKSDTDEDTIYLYIPTKENTFIKINIIDLIALYFKGLMYLIKNSLNIVGIIEIILTCPAYFHDLQRSQLKKSAEKAGFKIFKMYNEPTSASIYYIKKYSELCKLNNKFIVYDLGGGTIDTTVVEYHIDNNTCEIIDIDGNSSLGGIDIDNKLIQDIYVKYLIDNTDVKMLKKIKDVGEDIKIKLSFLKNYSVTLENVPIKKGMNIQYVDSLTINYSQHQFNNLINNLIENMIESILKMHKKHLTTNIIFIGGPTQIPLLQNKVNSLLGITNSSCNLILNNDNYLYKTIVSHGSCLLFDLLKTQDNFCLLDIIPMNIGISSPEGQMITMIKSHSKIPVSVEKTFTTSHDCQRTINIEVFEGIHDLTIHNNFIGSYKIIGIPPLARGSIIIKLLFKISYNGILDVEISGFKNPSDNSAKSFDFKMTEKIKLIPSVIAKELLKKILERK